MAQQYDIIGDIHGQAAELAALLEQLGYHCSADGFRHPQRQAIFVGDFIDRGDQQRAVLDIVQPMIASKAALAIMGNHEYNAIAYHTPDPANPGEYLRARNPQHTGQHSAFLDEYQEDSADWQATIDWFKSLPLWLDLGPLRVVHACWHAPSMAVLAPQLAPGNRLTDGLLVRSSRKGCAEYDAMETLLKGLEVELPDGLEFQDKDGVRRSRVRTRWWLQAQARLSEVAIAPPSAMAQLPDLPFDMQRLPGYPAVAPPVFVGHYWFAGVPAPLARNVAGTDYSVARPDGKLVAYRWQGEQQLLAAHFVSQPRLDR